MTASELRALLEQALSSGVRPYLRSQGFTKHGRTFRRTRGPLYDMINFQGSKHNQFSTEHSFFVNVGVGSAEIDAVHTEWPRDDVPTREYVLDGRWWKLAGDLPAEVTFDHRTSGAELAEHVNAGPVRVLAVIDTITTSLELAEWAAANNVLRHMEKTAAYLASVDADDTLRTYAATVRERMSEDNRWPFFSNRFAMAIGDRAASLIADGVLEPPA